MRARIEAALAGDTQAQQHLLSVLQPVVEVRIRAVLMRCGAQGERRVIQQDVLDFVQDVFEALFADDGRVLRAWDPHRQASLATFVGVVAERFVLSAMRSRRRNPWSETPVEPLGLTAAASHGLGVERRLAQRQMLRALLGRLRDELTPLGYGLFEDMMLGGRTVAEVCAARQMSRDAVYTWRARLRRLIRQNRKHLGSV